MLLVISMPFIGALIGWLTNYLAVRMLFRPLKPVRIPATGITIQGVIPKRKADLSRIVGETVQRELVTPADIVNLLVSSDHRNEMIDNISAMVEAKTSTRLPAILPNAIKSAVARYVGDLVRSEADEVFGVFAGDIRESLRKDLNIAELVEKKVSSLSDEDLERLVLRVASRELRHIVALGAVLGFLIGLVQACAISLVR